MWSNTNKANGRNLSKDIIGRTVVSKSGKKCGLVGDLIFESKTGELIYLTLKTPTSYVQSLNLEKGKSNELLIPFSAVMSIGDFLIVSVEDIV